MIRYIPLVCVQAKILELLPMHQFFLFFLVSKISTETGNQPLTVPPKILLASQSDSTRNILMYNNLKTFIEPNMIY